MHNIDPFQSQLSYGAFSGATSPFQSPYATAMNPALSSPFAGTGQMGAVSPFVQQGYGQGMPNYAAIAQQQQLQQLAQILAAQQSGIPQLYPGIQQSNPWQSVFGQQQPGLLQNPLIAATLQNPQLNPMLNPLLAQQLAMQSGYGQQSFGQNPFVQPGYPLAPQSWVGQQGQIHPHHLQQLAQRGIY